MIRKLALVIAMVFGFVALHTLPAMADEKADKQKKVEEARTKFETERRDSLKKDLGLDDKTAASLAAILNGYDKDHRVLETERAGIGAKIGATAKTNDEKTAKEILEKKEKNDEAVIALAKKKHEDIKKLLGPMNTVRYYVAADSFERKLVRAVRTARQKAVQENKDKATAPATAPAPAPATKK